jgi:hypothetical protein
MPTLEGVKILKQVKKFLTDHLNKSHWEDLQADPTMVILSFDKDSHLVLGYEENEQNLIMVFIHGRYGCVYSTLGKWKEAITTMDHNMAAFHIWLST